MSFMISFSLSLNGVDGSSEPLSLAYEAAARESESLSQDKLEDHRQGNVTERAWARREGTRRISRATAKEAIVAAHGIEQPLGFIGKGFQNWAYIVAQLPKHSVRKMGN